MSLVGGILAANAVYLAVGYSLLAFTLRGRPLRDRLSWAGFALLTGVVAVGLGLTVAAVLGARAGLPAFFAVSALLAAGGLAAARLAPAGLAAAPRLVVPAPRGRIADAVVTTAAFGVVAICLFGLAGGFRSSAWLDDVWHFWLPRGLAIEQLGLDERLFAPSGLTGFHNPYYPLLWSLVLSVDAQLVGEIDLRAPSAQLSLLVVAFVAALARLLQGRVRAEALWPGLLLLVSSPALFRQAQAGGADLPLAFFLVLAVGGAAWWLAERVPFALVVLFVGAAGALAAKREGLPQLVLFLAIVAAAGALSGRRRALPALAATTAAAALTAVPWLLWQLAHDALDDPITAAAVGGASRADVARTAVEQLVRWSLRPQEWLFVLPLFFTLALVVLVRERRVAWVAPPALVLAGYLFWVWFFATDPYGTVASFPIAYRVVDALLVFSAASIPVLADRLWRT
jgi:hypothetical protein